MWHKKIGYAYYIAALLGSTMTYKRACTIANSFTEEELKRVWCRVKGRTGYGKAA